MRQLLDKIAELEKVSEEKTVQIEDFRENYIHKDERIEESIRIKIRTLERENRELQDKVTESNQVLDEKKQEFAALEREKQEIEYELKAKLDYNNKMTGSIDRLGMELVKTKQDLGMLLTIKSRGSTKCSIFV